MSKQPVWPCSRRSRSLRRLLPARHGCRLGAASVSRHGPRVVPDCFIGACRRRTTTPAANLPILQGAVQPNCRRARILRRERWPAERHLLYRHGVQLLQRHRVPGSHRGLRVVGAHTRNKAPHRRMGDSRRTRNLAQKQGMRTLRTEAVNLVAQDVTTVAEVIRSLYTL